MIELDIGDVSAAVGARYTGSSEPRTVKRVVIDSREVRPGDLFVAIRGARLDGHQFVDQATAQGASVCMIDERSADAGIGRGVACVVVADTVVALGRLAAYYRREVMFAHTKVVAITGSNGKTTTKQMLDHVLSAAQPGKASPKSFNNDIGVPLTVLAADADDRYLIAEIGTNAPGEVAALAQIVEPDVAVVTSIGEAHLEGLGTVEAVAKEKASLLGYVRSGGLAVVNVDRDEILPHLEVGPGVLLETTSLGRDADVVARVVEATLRHTVVELDGVGRFELSIPGAHHAVNAAAVMIVARHLGVEAGVVLERLGSFAAQPGRAEVTELGSITLVDDAYNANPSSMAGAVETLAGEPSRRHVMIMGDMFELGDRSGEFHAAMIDRAFASGVELVVTVGRVFAQAATTRCNTAGRALYCFEDAPLAAQAAPALLQSGDCVWVKGSRAVGLECVVDRLRRELAPPPAVT